MGALSTLTDKRELFCRAYVNETNCNASEAARIAGYQANGHSLTQIASNLLTIVDVKARIQELFAENGMSASETRSRIADHARASVEDIGNVDGGMFFLDLDKAKQRGKLHTIASVEYTDKGQLKVKMHDSLAALDKLAKIHGLYKDEGNTTNIVNVTVSEEDREERLLQIMERARQRRLEAAPAIDLESSPVDQRA